MSDADYIRALEAEIALLRASVLAWNKSAVDERVDRDALLDSVEAAHANVRACLDPKVEGKFGLLMMTESILRCSLKAFRTDERSSC